MGVVTATFEFVGVGEDFGPRADGFAILHTTESAATANTVDDAINVARWQDRGDVAGSYNRLICIDGVLSTVPDDHASGGVNPGSYAFAPKPWLYLAVDADEVNNPNFFATNLAAVGAREHFDRYGWPDRIIDGFARSIIEEEQRIGRRVVIANHADFQTNRTDAGAIAKNLVEHRVASLRGLPDTATEDDVDLNKILHQVPKLVRIPVGIPLFTAPEAGAPFHRQVGSSDVTVNAFTAEVLGGYGGFWEGRKRGGPGRFFARQSDIPDDAWLGSMVYPDDPLLSAKPAPADCSEQDAKLAAVSRSLPSLRAANKAESVALEALAKEIA